MQKHLRVTISPDRSFVLKRVLQSLNLRVDELLYHWKRASPDSGICALNEPLQITALEQRILMSASPLAAVAEAVVEPIDATSNVRFNDTASLLSDGDSGTDEQSEVTTISDRSVSQSTIELVVIDPSADAYEQLVADLESNDDRSFEILLLNPQSDGIAQITDALSNLNDVSVIHLVSHGDEGEILLGTSVLSQRSLHRYASELITWQHSLTADADLLIYGCDLAASESGIALTESLNTLIGTDIAASDNETGYEKYNADWDLEYSIGDIEATVAFTTRLRSVWEGKLASVTVDTTLDIVDGDTSSVAALKTTQGADGFISLREAILAVNNGSGGDTINLGAGTYSLSIVGSGENAAATGDLDITVDVTIAGADATSTVIDADGIDRVFNLRSGANVTMSDVTIAGGFGESGAGVYMEQGANFTLTNGVISGNDSDGADGGGVYNKDGILTLTDVTVSGNSAVGKKGGGIDNRETAYLMNVTIVGNSAKDGGGINTEGGGSLLSLTNVTVSANTATAKGGGLRANETTDITNATIALNIGEDGAGIHRSGGTLTLKNTILADNTHADLTPENVTGTVVSNDFNIDSDGTARLSGVNDQVADPLLAPLAANGGVSQTHAITSSSPAYDSGTEAGAPTVDQRRVARDATPDVGAFEFIPASAHLVVSTAADVGSLSGAPGLDSWSDGEAVEVGAPSFTLEPGGTNGTFSSLLLLDGFAADSDADIDALHYVGTDFTVGGVPLEIGDIIFSTAANETLSGTGYLAEDVLLFEPTTPGDYSAGTFSILIDKSDTAIANAIQGVSLVEQQTTVGDVTFDAGDLLFLQSGNQQKNNIYRFQPNALGGTTVGTRTKPFDGDNIGIAEEINGIALVQSDTSLGDETLTAGQLLLSMGTIDNVGTGPTLSVADQDIFVFDITPAPVTASGTLLFEGADLGFSAGHDWDAIALRSTTALPPPESVWLSTSGDVASPSGVTGLNSWGGDSSLALGNPDLALGSGTSDGTLSSLFKLDTLADDGNANLDAAHYVTTNITVGGANAISLQVGDVLFSTAEREQFNGGTLTIENRDVGLFRPDTIGDYSSGAFSILLDDLSVGGIVGPDVYGISLVEQTTTFGDTVLQAGDFLYTHLDDWAANDVFLFETSDVGAGTTSGTSSKLIEGNDIGLSVFSSFLKGIEFVESETIIGGTTVASGTLLLHSTGTQTNVGTSNITTTTYDVFALDVTATTLVAGTAVADASIFLRGSDLGLDTSSESLDSLALGPSPSAPAGSSTISGTIFEDIDADGDILDDGVGAAGVTVDLYIDDGLTVGEIDAADSLVTSVTTDGTGSYTFTGLGDDTYWVVVDSSSIDPDAGFNGGFSSGDAWAEQTYGAAGSVSFAGSYSYAGTAGAFYGGMQGEVSDNASALTTAEHVTRVTVSGSDVTDIDSGFSFNAITNTGDDGAATGPSIQGSLRQFLFNSNAIDNTLHRLNSSQFAIPTTDSNYDGSGNGEFTITPSTVLPNITDAIILDGTTQAGYAGTPIIELNGSLVTAGDENGFTLQAGGSTVRGFVINRFLSDAIEIEIVGGNTIGGNFIGTDVTGTLDRGNAYGISVKSNGNTIGGTTSAQRNIISASNAAGDGWGIGIYSGATNNQVLGNFIGTDVTGAADLGNSIYGVYLASDENTIGGTLSGSLNVISGNDVYGVYIASSSNAVSGNHIGTVVDGLADLGNTVTGIFLTGGAASNTIGGLTTLERNVISGNNDDGLKIEATAGSGNVVVGNYVGLDATGDAALGNGGSGIDVQSDGNTIGGASSNARNVVSGSFNNGIVVSGASNTVQGNYVGTDSSGNPVLANGRNGVWVNGGSNNAIGGTTTGEENLIAGNSWDGVRVSTGSGNSIRRNSIFANTLVGINLESGNLDRQTPNLTSVVTNGGTAVTITGSYSDGTLSNEPLRIEYFKSSGSAQEGEVFLDFRDVVTDGSGNYTINHVLTANVAVGEYITATATDSSGNTSEFSVTTQATATANLAPTLTLFSNSVGSTLEDTEAEISFADLTTAGNENDVDGTVDGFVVKTISTGTLKIGATAASATAWVSGSNDTVDAINNVYWTPNINATGTQNAFAVIAKDDGGLESTGNVTAQVDITPVNDAPLGLPTIMGTVTEDQILTADTSGISDADGVGAFSYQWLRNGGNIAGATGSTYTLGDTDVGQLMSVEVSYTDDNLTAEGPVTSAQTAAVANVNDIPTGSVTIDDTTPNQGDTLNASNTLADVDGLTGPITYQWQRNGSDISGATAASHTTVVADVGTVITVVASYTDGHGTSESVSSAATAAVGNVNDPPIGSVTISGTPTEDQTLTASNTLADPDGMGAVSYQWQRNGLSIGGAISNTYTLDDADVGSTITVIGSYTDGGGTPESVSSSGVGPINNVNDATVGLPTITGTVIEDQILTADTSGISDADGLGPFSYQWLRNGGNIAGAISNTYTLDDTDVGQLISVDVRYVDGQGTSESLTSTQTAAVLNVNDLPGGTVSISGSPGNGSLLTASNTVTDDDGLGSIGYQWRRNGIDIAGGTGLTHLLSDADVGSLISVAATYVDGQGTVESVSSPANGPIANVNDLPGGAVTVSGSPSEGSLLTVGNTLTDNDGLGLISYQWNRNGTPIVGVTATNYTLGPADVGNLVSVVASYTDGHGVSESVASNSIGPVTNVNNAPTGVVVISGIPTEDEVLTVSNTLADADGLGVMTYQWRRNGVNIVGATSTELTLGDADVDAIIAVVASYTDGGGTNESVVSGSVGPIANVKDAPTITAISDQVISEEGSTGPLTFSVADMETPVSLLTVTATSSDIALIPDSNILLTNLGGGNWTIAATAAVNQHGGPLTITVTVGDGTATAVEVFTLVINAVNDAPQLNSVSTIHVQEDEAVGTALATVSATDVDTADLMTYSIVSGNTGDAFVITPTGTISLHAPLNFRATSSYVLTVQVSDGGAPNLTDTVDITILIQQVIVPAPATSADDVQTVTEEAVEGESETIELSEPAVVPESQPQRSTSHVIRTGASETETLEEEIIGLVKAVVQDSPPMFFDAVIETHITEVVDSDFVTTTLDRVVHDDANSAETVQALSTLEFATSAFSDDLSQMRGELNESAGLQFYAAATAVSTTGGLTVGYILWALRGGWLASSILAQMPAWRLIDPLVVLSSLNDGDDLDDDESLQDMIQNGVKDRPRVPELETA